MGKIHDLKHWLYVNSLGTRPGQRMTGVGGGVGCRIPGRKWHVMTILFFPEISFWQGGWKARGLWWERQQFWAPASGWPESLGPGGCPMSCAVDKSTAPPASLGFPSSISGTVNPSLESQKPELDPRFLCPFTLLSPSQSPCKSSHSCTRTPFAFVHLFASAASVLD